MRAEVNLCDICKTSKDIEVVARYKCMGCGKDVCGCCNWGIRITIASATNSLSLPLCHECSYELDSYHKIFATIKDELTTTVTEMIGGKK